MFISLSKDSESGGWLRTDLLFLHKRLPTSRECSVLCCEKEFLRSIMLRQEGLAFFKAISTLQLSPAILKELRLALSLRKKKPGDREPQHRVRGRGRSPQRTSGQLVGKLKANELASSGDSSEPARRPVQSRANKLHLAADNSVRPRVERRTRLS